MVKLSPHWFRHTFVTSLLEQDVPLAVVKDLAGHDDISVEIYTLNEFRRTECMTI
ncbi:tyrosine-type recombinase/integrase [Domibacillus epiphyticus]|uniref:tyrosine-type recombinase/integrase n=1 Tax=Domibacillus epiphyticus TaxID=1714355 RepID=UPI001E2FFAA4|nr:site-specific integrase [Domibacillus epiphyticus]